MITRFRVQNYKALRDVTLDLTPIHVLIGQNDTGKTSILEALAALSLSVETSLPKAFPPQTRARDLVWNRDGPASRTVSLAATFNGGIDYSLQCVFGVKGGDIAYDLEMVRGIVDDNPPIQREVTLGGSSTAMNRLEKGRATGDIEFDALGRQVCDQLSGVRIHRWVPEMLAIPVVPYPRGRYGMEPSGFGLALALDDILGEDRQKFIELERRFCAFFPEIKHIKLRSGAGFQNTNFTYGGVPQFQKGEGKGIHFDLGNEHVIPAGNASDGTLLVLAYLTILNAPVKPRLLLIEEPENGIHPRRLKDVLSMLRELVREQDHTQVVMTTHSPMIVDLFEPEEVSLCVKDACGAVNVQRLSDSKTVREQIDLFKLGEIWTGEEDDQLLARAEEDGESDS